MYGAELVCWADINLLSSGVLNFFIIWAIWYHYDWVHTYQINMGGKLKHLSKTAQRTTVHFIISIFDDLGYMVPL